MDILNKINVIVIPAIITIIIFSGMLKKVDCFSSFKEGAKDGITATLNILPTLVGLMVSISVFRASEALDLLVKGFTPIAKFIKIPPEVLPLAFLRPVSGGASLALLSDIFKQYGPDSLIGKISATMMGSTETVFYTVAVYLAGAGVKKTQYIIPVALIAGGISVIVACRVVMLFLG